MKGLPCLGLMAFDVVVGQVVPYAECSGSAIKYLNNGSRALKS